MAALLPTAPVQGAAFADGRLAYHWDVVIPDFSPH